MPTYSTIQQISDQLDFHTIRLDVNRDAASTAQSDATRALSEIYDTGLYSRIYTDFEIQKLKDAMRLEWQGADANKRDELLATMDADIAASLPGLLNGYYGPYADMQALYNSLLGRFGESDAAINDLLNRVLPGIQSDVDSVFTTASAVATNFDALQESLKSVLVVFAIDGAGNDQSLVPGMREYVLYFEYNGTPPALPVAGTFTKFVGTPQSTWPVYASTASGNDQSFEPGSREFVTFYNSPVAPDLPLFGEVFVRYIGTDGADGPRGSGRWYVSVSSLPSTTSSAAQNAWINAYNSGQDIPAVPTEQDQVYFYTGALGNPTGQRVFICQFAVNASSHGWDYQENVMRGDLLVPGTVTALEINTRGLSITDEYGNVILQATGGSTGVDWARILQRPQSLADLDLAAAQQLDQKSVTYYQTTAPSTSIADIGDIWFDTNDNFKMYAFNGSSWNVVQDSAAASAAASAAQADANSAQFTADGKIVTFYATSTPYGASAGDLWYNSSTKRLNRFNGSSWLEVSNYTTNTSELADGAALGSTAVWTYVYGSGRPADNADVTQTAVSNGVSTTNLNLNNPTTSAPSYVAAVSNTQSYYALRALNTSLYGGALAVQSSAGWTTEIVQTLNSAVDTDQAALVAANTSSGGSVALARSSNGGGYAVDCVTGDVRLRNGTFLPFTGSHEAMIDKKQKIIVGDIVCDKRVIITDVLNSFTEVEVSSTPNQSTAVGVYLKEDSNWSVTAFLDEEAVVAEMGKERNTINARGKPTRKGGKLNISKKGYEKENFSEEYNCLIMNSLGEGGLNVCGENGDIAAGDLIVTSSMPGKGMKQADDIVRSYTVAKARESVSFKNNKEVKMIACIYMCG